MSRLPIASVVSAATLAASLAFAPAASAQDVANYSTPTSGQPDYAYLDERPSTGKAQIVVGWIATGVSAADFAFIPLCYSDFYPRKAANACAIATGVVGAIGVTVGVSLLIAGYGNRADYREWQESNSVAKHLSRINVLATEGGGQAMYTLSW